MSSSASALSTSAQPLLVPLIGAVSGTRNRELRTRSDLRARTPSDPEALTCAPPPSRKAAAWARERIAIGADIGKKQIVGKDVTLEERAEKVLAERHAALEQRTQTFE